MLFHVGRDSQTLGDLLRNCADSGIGVGEPARKRITCIGRYSCKVRFPMVIPVLSVFDKISDAIGSSQPYYRRWIVEHLEKRRVDGISQVSEASRRSDSVGGALTKWSYLCRHV